MFSMGWPTASCGQKVESERSMSDERELVAERERKAAELRQAGQNPYANGFSPRHTAAEVHSWFAAGNVPTANPLTDEPRAARFSVAGRIVALRSFGKAAFAKVRDRSGEIQVWVRQDVLGEKTFALWRALERGDFIGASGPAVIENWHGVKFEKPLQRTREYVEIIKMILSGGRVDYEGEIFSLKGFRLQFTPFRKDIPVLVAAIGPKNIRLAGEVADGWIPFMVPVRNLGEAGEGFIEGARSKGRGPDSLMVCPYITTAVSADAEYAKKVVSEHIAA